MSTDEHDLWVFGYGSLMWNPGFDHVERCEATLNGYHRALCIYSVHHRGTPEKPGLVLGLDRGGSCRGIAFRVDAKKREDVLAYLREREQVTSVYLETSHHLRLIDGRLVNGIAYTADRQHAQYAQKLPHEKLVELIKRSEGASGKNPDYVRATAKKLVDMGIHDRTLMRIISDLDAAGL